MEIYLSEQLAIWLTMAMGAWLGAIVFLCTLLLQGHAERRAERRKLAEIARQARASGVVNLMD